MIFIKKRKFAFPDSVVLALDANKGDHDQSKSAHTVTNTGVTVTENAEIYPGHVSDVFNIGNGGLSVPVSQDWYFTEDFSIDFWVKLNTSAAKQYLLALYTDVATKFRINKDTSNNISFFIRHDASTAFSISGVYAFNDWHHLGIHKTGNLINLFQNGAVAASSDTIYTPRYYNVPLSIGNKYGGGYEVDGQMANIRVVKGSCLDYQLLWTAGKLFRLKDAYL